MAKKVEYVISLKDKTKAGLAGVRKGLKSLKGPAIAIGAAFAAIGVAAFVASKKAIKAFAIQQKALVSLNSAVANAGIKTNGFTKELRTLASQIQNDTRFGDEFLLGQMAIGLQMGIGEKTIKKATVAAVGLAEAYEIDLSSAMKLVAKANAGQTGELSRYGIVLDKSGTKQEQFNELLDKGIDKFQTAKDKAKTLSGQYEALFNDIGDVSENFGEAIVVALGVEDGLEGLIKKVREFKDSNAIQEWALKAAIALGTVKGVAESIGGIFSKITNKIKSVLPRTGLKTPKKTKPAYQGGGGVDLSALGGGSSDGGGGESIGESQKVIDLIIDSQIEAMEDGQKKVIAQIKRDFEKRMNEIKGNGSLEIALREQLEKEMHTKIQGVKDKNARDLREKEKSRQEKGLQQAIAGFDAAIDEANKSPEQRKQDRKRRDRLAKAKAKVDRETNDPRNVFKASTKDKEILRIAGLEKAREDAKRELLKLESDSMQATIDLKNAIVGKDGE